MVGNTTVGAPKRSKGGSRRSVEGPEGGGEILSIFLIWGFFFLFLFVRFIFRFGVKERVFYIFVFCMFFFSDHFRPQQPLGFF